MDIVAGSRQVAFVKELPATNCTSSWVSGALRLEKVSGQIGTYGKVHYSKVFTIVG